MIIGIGNDLCNIERIEQVLAKHPQLFINRILSVAEQEEMRKMTNISSREYACRLAKRFAAKEACSKALGTGLRQGTFWKDMQITHLPSGKPQLNLTGGALKNAQTLANGQNLQYHVSMTDDFPWAQAFVIIETI